LSADLDLEAQPKPRCADCRHFDNAPRRLEAALPGLAALSSADNASRSDDGLCVKRGRYLSARASCADFWRRG